MTTDRNMIKQLHNVTASSDCVCLYESFCAVLTLAMSVRLSEAALVPAGQCCVSLVVVGSILAVICPQGPLRAPLLQTVRLTLLQSWPIGQKVIAIQIWQGKRGHKVSGYEWVGDKFRSGLRDEILPHSCFLWFSHDHSNWWFKANELKIQVEGEKNTSTAVIT